MFEKQPKVILEHISFYLECEEYGKLLVSCSTIYQVLVKNILSKKPFYLFYGNSYGPMTFAEMAFPAKYEKHIDLQEYDGLCKPRVDLNSYIAAQVCLIDVKNVPEMTMKIYELQNLAAGKLAKELKYFPKIHKRNQLREINIINDKNTRNKEFWCRSVV